MLAGISSTEWNRSSSVAALLQRNIRKWNISIDRLTPAQQKRVIAQRIQAGVHYIG